MTRRRAGLAALALAALGCGAPPAPAVGQLWTLDGLRALGNPAVTEAGARLRLLSAPFAETDAFQGPRAGLTVFPAFSEGMPAAYLTTEVWNAFPRVWVQPLYVPVAQYQSGPLAGAGTPVFGVDATSRFYSPYWQIFYYVPPAGASFHSAKEVLDSRVALHPGPGKVCVITDNADGFSAVAEEAAAPVRPLNRQAVGIPGNGRAWVDGRQVSFVDLGLNRFRWNAALEVEETPLYGFTRVDASGVVVPLELPRVGGSGPPGQPNPDDALDGAPQFGALWRGYEVRLPADAGVFVPADQPALRAWAQAQGLAAPLPAAEAAARPDVRDYTLRVAVNPACFQGADFPAGCHWLDSQAQIERLVPSWAIRQTDQLVSCPLLLYRGRTLGPK